MYENHKKKFIILAIILAFLGVRYGILKRGDVMSIGTDVKSIIHDFKGFVHELVTGEPEEPKATKPARSKDDAKTRDSSKAK